MKTAFLIVAGVILMAASIHGHALDGRRFSATEEACYAQGMVALDSVINARLGVHPEDLLPLARIDPRAPVIVAYSENILGVIYGAYLWEGEPSGYAMRVFHRCLVRGG
ncbi:MAG: hypothetical protein IDH49_00055 [Gammaproteobacteria bacterium]|nr:hypothetical protein [Gammaproteobacteria bacterium]